jgi:hypothetical protein
MNLAFSNLSLEQFWTIIVGLLLGFWWIASVIHQFSFKWWKKFASHDPLNLLPRWTFFAPNPGRNDYHLVYRDWREGQPNHWMELSELKTDLRWRWIWNPPRYPSKAISDLVNGLFGVIQDSVDFPESVMLSSYYIGLLALVMSQPVTAPDVSHRQFAIVATQGFEHDRKLVVKYVAELHRAEL